MYKLRLGKSLSLFRDGFAEQVKEAASLGFDAMDLDLCALWPHRDKEIEAMKGLAAGLEITKNSGLYFNGVHISFGPHWDFSQPDAEKRKEALDNIREILPIIDAYHPHCYIIHGSFEPISDEKRPEHLAALHDSLAQMTSWTDTPIAVESLPRTCLFNTAKEGIAIIDAIPRGVFACVDVNHFLKEKSEDAVGALGSRIITTHISDHDYVDERHLLPGKGKIDWMALIGAFERGGYDGVFNYESAGTLAEIKENYETLFANYNKGKD